MVNPFKSIASFSKQLSMEVNKIEKATDKVVKAKDDLVIAERAVFDKTSEIRGEADALIIRARQINQLVDDVLAKLDFNENL